MKIPVWLVLLLIAGAVVAARATTPDPGVELRVDTIRVDSPTLLAEVAALELEAAGLRNRLAGRREVEPEVVYVAEDPIPAPEACQLTVRIEQGRLTASPLVMVQDSTGEPRYRASLLDGIDVTRCDDGLSVSPGGRVVCDRPVLGHLSVVGAGGILEKEPWAWMGLEWTPYWRSSWRATAGVRAWPDGATWEVDLSRRLWGIW